MSPNHRHHCPWSSSPSLFEWNKNVQGRHLKNLFLVRQRAQCLPGQPPHFLFFTKHSQKVSIKEQGISLGKLPARSKISEVTRNMSQLGERFAIQCLRPATYVWWLKQLDSKVLKKGATGLRRIENLDCKDSIEKQGTKRQL